MKFPAPIQPPHKKRKGSRIKIGILYISDKPFEGKLRVGLTTFETGVNKYLPFEIVIEN
jgi:hypothetical protein